MSFKPKLTATLAIIGLVLFQGCGRKNEAASTTANTPTSAAQNTPTADPNAGIDLAQMTRDLRRWILANQRPPKNFEDYAASATATIPTPPSGKKFSINKQMSVVLVNR